MKFDPEAIIFDFGGVLINVDYYATIEAFKDLGIPYFEELYAKAQQSKVFDQFETGQISSQRFINELLNYLPAGTSPNAIVNAWNAMIMEVPSESIELLEELKSKGKRLFLLSNTNELHIPVAYKAWGKVSAKAPHELFDKIYLSHEIHQRKPNPEAFELVIRDQKLDPANTLFIDDSVQHIEGALKVGLEAYHLQRIDDLYSLFS